jgi:hypothetical protein
MSTDHYDRYQQGTSSNCCGAIITMQGLCSDCGEHCTDDNEDGPTDEQQERMRESMLYANEKYRKDMTDAGREHLLP